MGCMKMKTWCEDEELYNEISEQVADIMHLTSDIDKLYEEITERVANIIESSNNAVREEIKADLLKFIENHEFEPTAIIDKIKNL